MKQTLLAGILLACPFLPARSQISAGYPITPVPFTSVNVTDQFWGQRLKASREVTIPLAFSKCEETGRYRNFEKAAHPSTDYTFRGLVFDDTDVYKTIEGAAYSLQTFPDKRLESYVDSVIAIVAAAQEADGYLYTPRTMNPEQKDVRRIGKCRWDKEEQGSHELYCLGHMIEGAVAYYQATGKRKFLDVAIRFADCADRELGNGEGKRLIVPEHQIAEMALVRLYLVTGEKRYLNLAKFFLDQRGKEKRTGFWLKDDYDQMHKPVVEQDEAVGHAVRATYMYAGMADVAALTGDSAYIKAVDKIWENIVSKKMYVTGGIGSTRPGESFGKNYELPNLTAYCETCAAIGNVYLNHRLFLLHGESKYYDVLERTLYNGLLSGVSLGGDSFFYPNPLEADGKYKFNADNTLERQPWFGCACCPSNICRFIPSVPGYVYAVKDRAVYVNLFMGNDSELKVDGKRLRIRQTTRYPFDGNVRLEISPRGKQQLALKIRIPGWARGEVVPSDLYTFADKRQTGYTVTLNGVKVEGATMENGYLTISRVWKKGDVVELDFDMQPRMVRANKQVEADRNLVAVERGPLVYCAEATDNDFDIQGLLFPDNPTFETINRSDILNGITLLRTQAQALSYDPHGRLQVHDVSLSLIPYYAWNHRGIGKMRVWIPERVEAVRMSK